jgi:O-acetyl-ADP-ribose deacetylase (regulator of RNase III)
LLASCYRNALDLAAGHGVETIAFPSISTGIYGYPVDLACRVALSELRDGLARHAGIRRTTVVCFDAGTLRAYEVAMKESE